MDKNSIRAKMRARRREVSSEDKAVAEADICKKLLALMNVKMPQTVVAVYLASPDEISLDGFIKQALQVGLQIVAPRWNGNTYQLARLKGLDETCLRYGPMGIREPMAEDIVLPQDVGAWLVPGLAFTADGRRLGYGGGWYDRLLSMASSSSAKLGIAYQFQMLDDLPSEPHDVKLTAIVLNNGTL